MRSKEQLKGFNFQNSADRGAGAVFGGKDKDRLPPRTLEIDDLDRKIDRGEEVLEIVVDPVTKVAHTVLVKERSS